MFVQISEILDKDDNKFPLFKNGHFYNFTVGCRKLSFFPVKPCVATNTAHAVGWKLHDRPPAYITDESPTLTYIVRRFTEEEPGQLEEAHALIDLICKCETEGVARFIPNDYRYDLRDKCYKIPKISSPVLKERDMPMYRRCRNDLERQGIPVKLDTLQARAKALWPDASWTDEFLARLAQHYGASNEIS